MYGNSNYKDREDLLDKLRQIPFKSPHVAEVAASLSSVEMNSAWIDVTRLMQKHPYITHADARVSRAYRIFRTMGLRHLYVTPDRPLVVGVMTRKDVIQENTSLTLSEKAQLIEQHRRIGGGDAEMGVLPSAYADDQSGTKNLPTDDRDEWNDQFDTRDEEEEEEEEEHLPYIPYYQGNIDGEEGHHGSATGGTVTASVSQDNEGAAGSSGVSASVAGGVIVRRGATNGGDDIL